MSCHASCKFPVTHCPVAQMPRQGDMPLQSSVVLPSGSWVLTHTLPAVNVYSFSSMCFLQGGPQGAVSIFNYAFLFNQAGYGLA